jgi:hypothetical protein
VIPQPPRMPSISVHWPLWYTVLCTANQPMHAFGAAVWVCLKPSPGLRLHVSTQGLQRMVLSIRNYSCVIWNVDSMLYCKTLLSEL